MSAGAGIRHAEYNREQQPTRIFQIWIESNSKGGVAGMGVATVPQGGSFWALRDARERLRRRQGRTAHSRPRPACWAPR